MRPQVQTSVLKKKKGKREMLGIQSQAFAQDHDFPISTSHLPWIIGMHRHAWPQF
jgi:hypothetical protein